MRDITTNDKLVLTSVCFKRKYVFHHSVQVHFSCTSSFTATDISRRLQWDLAVKELAANPRRLLTTPYVYSKMTLAPPLVSLS